MTSRTSTRLRTPGTAGKSRRTVARAAAAASGVAMLALAAVPASAATSRSAAVTTAASPGATGYYSSLSQCRSVARALSADTGLHYYCYQTQEYDLVVYALAHN